jgi:hypothetical protein
MLRTDIKRLIDSSSSSDEASMLICQHLENELELGGNGWFDGDPVLEPYFMGSDAEDSDGNPEDPEIEAASKALFQKVRSILSPQPA